MAFSCMEKEANWRPSELKQTAVIGPRWALRDCEQHMSIIEMREAQHKAKVNETHVISSIFKVKKDQHAVGSTDTNLLRPRVTINGMESNKFIVNHVSF